uniref:Major facilitator superfamily (MFS) profile domain-containing protein n=1 Tax=Grammatophora oceanica TaxID=210454 RepID=A0A7S1V463_9STRA|mmetsp:Transcript_36100/g.53816  ORF Transcript_36100/g.53816 Transcript_36100/m.53816 type:complete len:557 (+) Transcript_36100:317-1987(+)|eukprot:CAMPEP_0194033126 /NCGR_PEP_ID=MMETSP0009_2-20130614/5912_1 /TAXON_ID=210454 /ORGANISM="Grammatophora oceanica, Strain CCMP 410" /LENGTH=556 /DNA_ID=CAMNT_0038673757 /DNA_START=313 /DNA_END=1983 /DNA_ORIENTATION=+
MSGNDHETGVAGGNGSNASNATPEGYRRSVSEAASSQQESQPSCRVPPALASIVEWPFQIRSVEAGKILPEATGWSMDAAAKGPLNMAGTHIGNALIVLAMAEAGCTSRQCDARVYGIRATSILPVTSMVTSIIAGLVMPIVGSIVDHTSHRKLVGSLTAFFVVVCLGGQIAISEDNWFIMLCLEGVGAFMLQTHITAVFAYLPDLSMYEHDFIRYTSGFNVRQTVSQLLHAVLVVVVGILRPDPVSRIDGSIRNARTSASIAFAVSSLLFGYSWIVLFRRRPPLSDVPEGQTLVSAGFRRIHKTAQLVWENYHALKWLMIALLWSPEVGTGLILSITTTFLSVWLEMTAMEISVISLAMLVASIPGAFLSRVVCGVLDPLRSYQLALVCFMGVAALTAGLLDSPERKNLAYGTGVMWGICIGWLYPTQRVLFCTLIPRGQEMEFMGIFTFFGNILSWLPPLLFTILNERNVSMQWGLSLIPFFLFASFACTLCMGSFKQAVAQISDEPKEDLSLPRREISAGTDPIPMSSRSFNQDNLDAREEENNEEKVEEEKV